MPVTLSALVHAREFYVHSTGGLARHGADVMSCEAIIANHHDVSPGMISVQSSTSTATPKDERSPPLSHGLNASSQPDLIVAGAAGPVRLLSGDPGGTRENFQRYPGNPRLSPITPSACM